MLVKFVAGLYYAPGQKLMLLIKKHKPGHWQHEKHNLLGGHIEEGERPHDAMIREFKEETGVDTPRAMWAEKLVLVGPTWVVHFYLAMGPVLKDLTPCDEGTVDWHGLIPETAIPNLKWIIPMMLDSTIIFPIHVQDSK